MDGMNGISGFDNIAGFDRGTGSGDGWLA